MKRVFRFLAICSRFNWYVWCITLVSAISVSAGAFLPAERSAAPFLAVPLVILLLVTLGFFAWEYYGVSSFFDDFERIPISRRDLFAAFAEYHARFGFPSQSHWLGFDFRFWGLWGLAFVIGIVEFGFAVGPESGSVLAFMLFTLGFGPAFACVWNPYSSIKDRRDAYRAERVYPVLTRSQGTFDLGTVLASRKRISEELAKCRKGSGRPSSRAGLFERTLSQLDEAVIPALQQMTQANEHIRTQLAAYQAKELPAPNPALLAELRERDLQQRGVILSAARQVVDAEALLVLLSDETSEQDVTLAAKRCTEYLDNVNHALRELSGSTGPSTREDATRV